MKDYDLNGIDIVSITKILDESGLKYHEEELKNNYSDTEVALDVKDVNSIIRIIEPKDEFQISNLNEIFDYNMNLHDPFFGYTDSSEWMNDERNTIYAAMVDEKMVGFVSTYFLHSYFKFDERVCYINKIYVLPEYRKSDIGKELINEIFNHAHSNNAEYVVASVMPENITAKWFFEGLGFKKTKGEGYYKQVQKVLKNRNK